MIIGNLPERLLSFGLQGPLLPPVANPGAARLGTQRISGEPQPTAARTSSFVRLQ